METYLWCLLAGVAERNPLSQKYVDEVLRFIPVLKAYKLERGAAHLQAWVQGTLDRAPLLDVSMQLADHYEMAQ